MDGTIVLNSTEQYISDIFASHEIYGFQRTYPTATSAPVNQYYSIFCKSKDLINELYDSVPSNIFFFDRNYTDIPLSSELINLLDGKTFYLKSRCEVNIAGNTTCPEDEVNVPDDFNLLINFNYNPDNELLYITSDGLTPLGNSFNIAIKGTDFDIYSLQLWESTPETIETYTLPYPDFLSLEMDVFFMFGIGCEGLNSGEFTYQIFSEDSITFIKETGLESTTHLKFEDYTLSIAENNLELIKLINNRKNPYITFSNIDNDSYFIEIFSVLGTRILNKTPFENNKISTFNLANGLHFIKLTNSNNQSKVYKFLKM